MALFKKRENKNLLDLIPLRVLQHYTESEDLITLHVPKFKNQGFARFAIPKGRSMDFHIKLDQLGSQVWKQMDGIKSIQQICDQVRSLQAEPDKVSDLEERTAKFITELYKSRFIKFMEEKQ